MSSGARGRVSIHNMIENIKEITGLNHTEDGIYAVLKECSMDPNETAQRLLLLDTFHEVKKKRDRRKQNLSKESAQSRLNPGNQARVNIPGRGNYYSRHVPHDAGGGRHSFAVEQNSTSQVSQKVTETPLANAQETKKNEASSGESSFVSSQIPYTIHGNHASASGGANLYNDTGNTNKRSHISSDPTMLPSEDVPLSSAISTVGQETGSKHTPVKLIAENTTERKSASGVQQIAIDFQGVVKTQYVERLRIPLSTTDITSDGRPFSNYRNQSQVASQLKGDHDKERKPKSTAPSVEQGARTTASSVGCTISDEGHPELQQNPKKTTRDLEKLCISDSRNVIIPNHLQVPDPGKLGLCFGSFDASFGLDMDRKDGFGGEKSPLLSYEANEEPVKGLHLSNETVLETSDKTETKYHINTKTLVQRPEDFSSGKVDVSPCSTPGYDEPNQEVSPGSHQHPDVHASLKYNIGFMLPILSSQLTPFETSESHAHEAPRLPGFIVQQPFDPASYNNQDYLADSEGGISYLQASVASNEQNGNVALLSTQTSQSLKEVPVLSPTGPLVTQAAELVQSSISPTQPSLPILGHYLPVIPYSPYLSPYYVPQPAIHQYFPMYLTPPGSTAKYLVPPPQYNKQGSDTGSSTHIGVFGCYGLPVPNYTSTADTSTSNEDLVAPQKETYFSTLFCNLR